MKKDFIPYEQALAIKELGKINKMENYMVWVTKTTHSKVCVGVSVENEKDIKNNKFIVQDIQFGTQYEWTIDDILKEINRDRSEKWTDYDETDWEEGWYEWCENDVYKLVEIK